MEKVAPSSDSKTTMQTSKILKSQGYMTPPKEHDYFLITNPEKKRNIIFLERIKNICFKAACELQKNCIK